ncbi:MAG: flagellar hook-basal body complex protein FliE [Magnetovibrio sp.]|nr:flagellar hook-basal body complex protein FliE [Magnetovibrio sp.]
MAIDPLANIARATQAYDQAQKSGIATNAIPVQDPLPQGQGTFGSLVQNYVDQAQQIGRVGEQVSIMGLQGQADMAQVATAVSEAEITLQTVVAVRDKVVDAYREILRMPM